MSHIFLVFSIFKDITPLDWHHPQQQASKQQKFQEKSRWKIAFRTKNVTSRFVRINFLRTNFLSSINFRFKNEGKNIVGVKMPFFALLRHKVHEAVSIATGVMKAKEVKKIVFFARHMETVMNNQWKFLKYFKEKLFDVINKYCNEMKTQKYLDERTLNFGFSP